MMIETPNGAVVELTSPWPPGLIAPFIRDRLDKEGFVAGSRDGKLCMVCESGSGASVRAQVVFIEIDGGQVTLNGFVEGDDTPEEGAQPMGAPDASPEKIALASMFADLERCLSENIEDHAEEMRASTPPPPPNYAQPPQVPQAPYAQPAYQQPPAPPPPPASPPQPPQQQPPQMPQAPYAQPAYQQPQPPPPQHQQPYAQPAYQQPQPPPPQPPQAPSAQSAYQQPPAPPPPPQPPQETDTPPP